MRRKLIFGGIFLFLSLLYWKDCLSVWCIHGKYVNNNTEPITDGPAQIQSRVDTLTLNEDGTFDCKTWGEGTYEVTSIRGIKTIDFSYKYDMGNAGFETYMVKPFFRNPRIILNSDLGFYFEKIEG